MLLVPCAYLPGTPRPPQQRLYANTSNSAWVLCSWLERHTHPHTGQVCSTNKYPQKQCSTKTDGNQQMNTPTSSLPGLGNCEACSTEAPQLAQWHWTPVAHSDHRQWILLSLAWLRSTSRGTQLKQLTTWVIHKSQFSLIYLGIESWCWKTR